MMAEGQTDKLKVVFILPALNAGGAERVLITLMNGLNRNIYAPEFIVVNDDGPMKSLISSSIPFHSLNEKKVSRSLLKLYLELKSIRPDIVISTMAHMNFCILLLKPFFPKTSFVVREAVTPSFIFKAHPRLATIIKLAYITLYPLANTVISPAQAIIDEFEKLSGMSCKNHRLLRNPVDVEKIRAHKDEKAFTIPKGRKNTVRFIAAGRLHDQKGFDRLINALPKLDMPYDWELLILGEGAERTALEKLIVRKGLSNKINLSGHASIPWPQYAAADCFVLPSRSEGLPNVVLEALACGTKVIGMQEAGGIKEIAEISEENSVTVVNNIDDFIIEMGKITPHPTQKYRKSLLPQPYDKNNVITQFEEILNNIVLEKNDGDGGGNS